MKKSNLIENGIYVQGNIYIRYSKNKKNQLGGVIGNQRNDNIPFSQIPHTGFTKENFIKAMCISPDDLRKIAKIIERENPKGGNYI